MTGESARGNAEERLVKEWETKQGSVRLLACLLLFIQSENSREISCGADVAADLVEGALCESGGVAQTLAVQDDVASGGAGLAGQQFRPRGDELKGGVAHPADEARQTSTEPALPLALPIGCAARLGAGEIGQRQALAIDLLHQPTVGGRQVRSQV